jgi:hypothetical protein
VRCTLRVIQGGSGQRPIELKEYLHELAKVFEVGGVLGTNLPF